MLLSVDLHHPAKLLIKLLLREHFQSGHLPDREEGAEVNELVRFCHGQVSQTFRDLIEWFGSCLEEVAMVPNGLIDIALSKQGVEDVVTRDCLTLDYDCVRDFEAFPHRVVLQLPQELRLNQLYLAKLPQIHVVQHVQPEALLDDLVLPPVLLRVHGLLELKVRSGKLLLFTLDFIKFVLQSRDVLLWEFVRLLVDQTEILSVQLDDCGEKLDCLLVGVLHQLERMECAIGKALALGELFDV